MISTFKKHFFILLMLVLAMFIANILALSLPLGLKYIIDAPRDSRFLMMVCSGLFFAVVIKSFLQWLIRRQASAITEQMGEQLSIKVFTHALNLSVLEIHQKKSIQVINHLTSDIQNIKLFGLSEAVDGIYSLMTIVISLIILSCLNLSLMWIAFGAFFISSLFLIRIVPKLKRAFMHYKDIYHKSLVSAQEALMGIRLVKTANTVDFEQNKFSQYVRKSSEIYLNNQKLQQKALSIVDLMLGCGLIVLLYVGAVNLQTWHLTAGTLAAFYSYILMMFAPLIRLGGLSGSFHQAKTSWDRLEDFLHIPLDIQKPTLLIGPNQLKGNLQVHELSFHYPQGSMVLDRITFTVSPGQTLGIVGPSGAGKTTLVCLLTGILQPLRGSVRIDGWDLCDIDKKLLAQQISVVYQEDHLFSTSIMDNIRYGSFDASDEEVYEAAKAARAVDFIETLSQGYQTVLTERGSNLSGGQRQRIALARALIKKPRILILDEATCSLDALTENDVQRSVRQFSPDTAIIIVAHRFSTIIDADRILVLQEGRIVEQGDHNYLLSRKGLYSTLYFEQFKNL